MVCLRSAEETTARHRWKESSSRLTVGSSRRRSSKQDTAFRANLQVKFGNGRCAGLVTYGLLQGSHGGKHTCDKGRWGKGDITYER